MPIELRPTGEPEAIAAAGREIGKAEKKEKQAQLSLQQRAAQAADQWELDKMILRSQQDFQQELRERQFQYDRVNEARQWEIDKMKIASQVDFERQEKARQVEMSKYQTLADVLQGQIDKGFVSPNDTNWQQVQAKLEFYKAKSQGVEVPVSLYTAPQKREVEPYAEARKILSNVIGTQEAATMSLPELIEEAGTLGYDISGFKGLSPEEPNVLDIETAKQILQEAKGDKELARQIARQRGYSF